MRGRRQSQGGFVSLIDVELLWRIEQLGWTSERFNAIDQEIARGADRYHEHTFKTDRYGKKYAVIAYNELAGVNRDAGQLTRELVSERPREMTWRSFPQLCPEEKLITDDLLGSDVRRAADSHDDVSLMVKRAQHLDR
jgi:hypothetical protein